jgi:hypothetical protein
LLSFEVCHLLIKTVQLIGDELLAFKHTSGELLVAGLQRMAGAGFQLGGFGAPALALALDALLGGHQINNGAAQARQLLHLPGVAVVQYLARVLDAVKQP